jgi:hypothetical protein
VRGNQNWKERVGELRHVLVFLLGRFKGEQGTRMHVFPLSDRTSSGIRIRLWLGGKSSENSSGREKGELPGFL